VGSFAGSASLGGFLTLRKLSLPKGGRIVFCNVDPNVNEVFRVSQIASLFAFVADVPAALALLAEPAGVGVAQLRFREYLLTGQPSVIVRSVTGPGRRRIGAPERAGGHLPVDGPRST